MNAPRRRALPLVSARPGSVSFRSGPQLLWTSGLLLAACLLVARPASAQSFGLGFSAVSTNPVSGWSIWTDVSVGLRSHPSHRWGANRGCPGHRFRGGYHYRGWGWRGPAYRGPLLGYPHFGRGPYRCLRPWAYGFGWSRPAFAWALYPIPLPYGGHPRFGYGAWSSPWSFDLHISFRLGPGHRWYGGHGYASRAYGNRCTERATRAVTDVTPPVGTDTGQAVLRRGDPRERVARPRRPRRQCRVGVPRPG